MPPPTPTPPGPGPLTVARLAAIGALLVAAVVVAVVLLSGGGGTKYDMVFQNAGQLVKGDQVQVGGRPIGTVKDIALTNHNLARVRVELNEFAPLHQGTTAVIRETSLSGIANRYISLTLGPNSAPSLKDGATLTTTQTTTPVDLYQLFDPLDPRTRTALQQVI